MVHEQQRWLKFFREGEQLNDAAPLPEWMNTDEMRQAMNTLRQFSEKGIKESVPGFTTRRLGGRDETSD